MRLLSTSFGRKTIPLQPARYLAQIVKPPSAADSSLIPFFDYPSPSTRSGQTTGLLLHPQLKTPADFQNVASHTLKRATLIVDRILRSPHSHAEMYRVVKNLDRLSDMLCRVIDLAELIRSCHPQPKWVDSANDVYEALCEFLNVLNTHVGLSEVLQNVLKDKAITDSMSYEAQQTALIFARDFERSGVHLPRSDRERFVTLSSEIISLGRKFLENVSTPRPLVQIPRATLASAPLLNPLKASTRQCSDQVTISPLSWEAGMIMKLATDEAARREVYTASNKSTDDQIQTLERLLRARAELACLVGKQSYAHMTLENKMAKSPENVHHFLDALSIHSHSKVLQYVHKLAQLKQAYLHTPILPSISAWDCEFYSPVQSTTSTSPSLSLTPGRVFYGLSRLFTHLYGIYLRPASIISGEVWHSSVRKLDVVDENEGVIGCLYIDLFKRPGKPSGGAAHYTVQCSRRVDDDDMNGDYLPGNCQGIDQRYLLQEFNHAIPGREGLYQRPIAALLCDFRPPTTEGGPVPLIWQEVLTLAHEMGHAIHTMLGRTDYQNVSGTRCATDLVELPSILMEHFMKSPTVLALFTPRSTPLIPPNSSGDSSALDTHRQILLASLDQIYHSPIALRSDFDSTREFANLQNSRGVIPFVPGTSWQTQFTHLFGYGATYYSYLFDRAIASHVWSAVFEENPLDRARGEKYRDELLRYGGGKDPWVMVSCLIDSPELATGDAHAMTQVGKWGVADDVSGAIPHL